jgi:hypothetical protein
VKRGMVCADKTNLTPPLFIEVPMPNQVMYLCVRDFDFVTFYATDAVWFLMPNNIWFNKRIEPF